MEIQSQKRYKNLNVTGLAHIKTDTTRCSQILINGALKLRQNYAFHGTDQVLTYADPIIDFSQINSMDELSISNFIQTLHDRDSKFLETSQFIKLISCWSIFSRIIVLQERTRHFDRFFGN